MTAIRPVSLTQRGRGSRKTSFQSMRAPGGVVLMTVGKVRVRLVLAMSPTRLTCRHDWIPAFHNLESILGIAGQHPRLLHVGRIEVSEKPVNLLAIPRGAVDEVHIGSDPNRSGVLAFGSEVSALGVGADEVGRVGGAEDGVAAGLGGVVDTEDELASFRLDACERKGEGGSAPK
jgi:hypothetical protein